MKSAENTRRGDIPSTEKDQNNREEKPEKWNNRNWIKLNRTKCSTGKEGFLTCQTSQFWGSSCQWCFLSGNVADTMWYTHEKSLPLDLRSSRKNSQFPATPAPHKHSGRSEDFSSLELGSTIYLILRQTPRTVASHCFSLLIYFPVQPFPLILCVDLYIWLPHRAS